MTWPRRAVLVVNTRSRKGRHLFAEARRMLTERGVTLDGAYLVRHPERLPEIVRDAVAAGHDFIIVGGGDGSISSVVDFLAHKPVTLGLLPLGTANCFARTLSIPFDLGGAVATLLDGKTVDVDLGRVGTDLFANAVAIGLPSIINQGIPAGLKRRFGRLGYLIYGVSALLHYRPFRCTVTTERETQSFDALEVRVVNGSYLGGLLVAEEASVESEDMVVQIVRGTRRRELVATWLGEMLGRRPSPERLAVLRGREIAIDTDPSRPVSVDGEVLAHTPIRCRVARQALRVMVPDHRADLD
jgi:YegS/Rv2252/BmrU family lipid kinase